MKNGSCTDRTRGAAIYRKAAAHLCKPEPREHWGCCDAINYAVNSDPVSDSLEREWFEHHFKPNPARGLYWGSGWGDGEGFWSKEIHQCRILALCFMAAMVEAGDA